MTYSRQYRYARYEYSQYAGAGSYWDLQFYNATLSQWESIKGDCCGQVIVEHGFSGNSLTDRIAGPGSIQFTLNNALDNTGGTQGYYSPGKAGCRSGFELGALFRFMISDGTTTTYQVRSKAISIIPVPGIHGEQKTEVMTADYFNDLANAPLQQIPIQVTKRIDQAIATIFSYMITAPKHTNLATGPETYTRLLSGMSDNKSSIITALQRLAQTDMSYLYLIHDADEGETMEWQHRQVRLSLVSSATFNDTMAGLEVERVSRNIINEVTTVAHPLAIDSAAVILAKTDALEFTIDAGATITMTLAFTDPAQLGRRIDMVFGSQPGGWPVANTDYKMGSGSGGSDLNANLTITPVWGANSIFLTLHNTAGAKGYVSLFHARGIGIYDYTPVEKLNADAASKLLHGTIPIRYDMPYCDNAKQADDFGKVILLDGKNPKNSVKSVSFYAHDINYPTFATLAATLDIGKAITLFETMTGINSKYFIQNMRWECGVGNMIKVTCGELENPVGTDPFKICAPGDDPTLATTSILALYDEASPLFTATDPYGNPFKRLSY